MIIGYKYNIQVREKANSGKTWIVYENAENGINNDPIFIDHIETEVGVPVWTNEKEFGLGFCMMCRGEITYKLNNLDGSRYLLIVPENIKWVLIT